MQFQQSHTFEQLRFVDFNDFRVAFAASTAGTALTAAGTPPSTSTTISASRRTAAAAA
jgi:hypothetical protein